MPAKSSIYFLAFYPQLFPPNGNAMALVVPFNTIISSITISSNNYPSTIFYTSQASQFSGNGNTKLYWWLPNGPQPQVPNTPGLYNVIIN